jgi:hypothetical protein
MIVRECSCSALKRVAEN